MKVDDKFTYGVCMLLALIINFISATIVYMAVEYYLGKSAADYSLTSYTAVALLTLKRFTNNIYRHVE